MTAVLGTFLLSAVLCGIYLRLAHSWRILDVPNGRSSHSLPTPHGGGMALLLAFAAGVFAAVPLYGGWERSFPLLSGAALLLAAIGLLDDLRGLAIRLRLLAYSAICLSVTIVLLWSALPSDRLLAGGLVLFTALGMLWSLNLYNFMDGIDGFAALQAVLACSAAAFLSWSTPGSGNYTLYCLLIAAAHCGFLVWNAPPARLFMGDAGSVPTGFLLAGLAVIGAVGGQVNPVCWLVLLAVFITDASWTLLWRIGSGQAFTQAHRAHAYQRLSRQWQSHFKVDLLLLTITLLWLFPLACAIQNWPELSMVLVFLAYLPLICGMAKLRGLT